MTAAHPTSIEERAIQLLGTGLSAEVVANALGVTASRISQLLSDEHISAEVTELRFQNLQKHNVRDNRYDELEDKLISKMEESLPLLYKPGEILGAIRVVNQAKRRGQSAPDQIVNQQNIVNIILPVNVVTQFTTNVNNQVVKAGAQELVTIQSGRLLEHVKVANDTTKNIGAEDKS